MDLPNLFSPTPKEKKYITIYFNHEKMQASLWQVGEQGIEVVKRSPVHHYQDDESCILETDKALQDLGKESEDVNEVVLGLEPSWTKESNIIDERRGLLKRLTDELSLKLVGFVSASEALTQHFIHQDPLFSAIILEVSDAMLSVYLLQRGKVQQHLQVGRSGELIADMNEVLARLVEQMKEQHLPPKMILFSLDFDQDELKDQQQQLMSQDWSKDFPFLHPPMVETQPSQLLIDAITFEAGTEVARKEGVLKVSTPVQAPIATPESQQFEFKDVEYEVPVEKEVTIDTELHDNLTAVDQSVVNNLGIKTEPAIFEDEFIEPKPERKLPHFHLSLPKWGKPKTAMADESIEKKLSHKPFILAGFVGGIVLLLLGGYGWLLFNAQASVTVKLNSKTISKETQLKLDPQAQEPDVSQLILPATQVSKEVTSDETKDTTGVKLLGDKARGKVTILNKTDAEKTFDKGTVVSDGTHKFTFDDSVKVASASVSSSSDAETKKFGKADVAVTAEKIGTDSNIGKDVELTVASYDKNTYSALSVESFSGGSSREVRVVAAEDIASLKKKLVSELIKEAQKKFDEESKNGTHFVTTGKTEVMETVASAKEGDETNTLNLELTLKVFAVSYQVSDLKPFATELLAAQVPSGYVLSQQDPQVLSSAEPSSGSSQVVLSAQISHKALPKVDESDLRKKITGKGLKQAKQILEDLPEIDTVTIQLRPPLIGKIFNRVPLQSGKIDLKLE